MEKGGFVLEKCWLEEKKGCVIMEKNELRLQPLRLIMQKGGLVMQKGGLVKNRGELGRERV